MSINLIEIEDANYWRDETGHLCREVTKGKIDHIAIVRAGAYRSARCWFADTPPDRMAAEIARARRHWFLGRIEHEQKQAEDRALVAKYLAKKADRQRPASRRKPEPMQIPEIPQAMRDAMRMGLYLS